MAAGAMNTFGAARANRTSRIDDIEALRAVAILFTLVGHTPILIPVPTFASDVRFFAWTGGVDLFLVVSGFVIAKSMLRYINADNRDFRSIAIPFWIRRAWRLLPAAWFWLSMSLITVTLFNTSTAFGSAWPVFYDAIAAVLQLANISLYACSSWMVGNCAPGGVPNGIYWSLSLEEQFYLLFPFFVCFLPHRFFIPAFAAIVLAQLFNDKIGLQWFLKTDGISIGVLVALVSQKGFYWRLEPTFLRRRWVRWLATAVFCLLLAAAASSSVRSVPFAGGMTAIVSGLWVFCASFDKGYVVSGSILRPIVLWIGTRSYSLYLAHMTAFSASHEILYRIYPHEAPTTFLLTAYSIVGPTLLILAAEGSYRFIEMPLREKGRLIARRRAERGHDHREPEVLGAVAPRS